MVQEASELGERRLALTFDAEGRFSRPLFVRLSRPLREEKRPLLRCR